MANSNLSLIRNWAVYSKTSDSPCSGEINGEIYVFVNGCPIPGKHLSALLIAASVKDGYLTTRDFDTKQMDLVLDPLFEPLAIKIEDSVTSYVIKNLRSYLDPEGKDEIDNQIINRATLLFSLLKTE